MSHQLLLVEDDQSLGYILKEYLEINNFDIDLAKDGSKGLSKIKQHDYDLCILDIMMPKMDGYTLAKKIKELDKNIPFVFLTAKTLKVDQLKGFNLGAEDYIVKPVDEEILIAKINAILSRCNNREQPKLPPVTIGKYNFDPNTRELTNGSAKQTLTARESEVLKLLCQNKGEVLTRKHALKTIWGESNYFNRRIMDVYISKLRKYLSEDPDIEIKNVHGTGFILLEQS